MKTVLLQKFLDNQFIRLENEADLDKLQKAVKDIKEKWAQDKKKIIQATLVALDPNVPMDDPLISEVQKTIIARWATFINSAAKTNDTPLTYIRAVILEVLQKLADSNIVFAALVWYSGNNVVKFFQLDREKHLMHDFLSETGELVEEAGVAKWQSISYAELEAFDVPEPVEGTSNQTLMDKNVLEGHLKAAASHSGWSRGGENPYTAAQNNHNWPEFFSERAARGISELFNKASLSQEAQMIAIQGYVKECLMAFHPYLKKVSSALLQNNEYTGLRTQLLWWKESLYSTSLKMSYRNMRPIVAAVCMATDLCDAMPDIFPVSVDFLLRETIYDLLGAEAEKTVTVLTKDIADNKGVINYLLSPLFKPAGRRPLVVFLKDCMEDKYNAAELIACTGISPDSAVSYADLSVWLLHDLQALKLANHG